MGSLCAPDDVLALHIMRDQRIVLHWLRLLLGLALGGRVRCGEVQATG